jgi:hypothetical protein
MAAPFNSGILATGARPGATYFYQPAEPDIAARVARIEAVCAGTASRSPPRRCSSTRSSAIASVVTGMGTPREAEDNLAHCRAAIPGAFWDEMKHEGLIARTRGPAERMTQTTKTQDRQPAQLLRPADDVATALVPLSKGTIVRRDERVVDA